MPPSLPVYSIKNHLGEMTLSSANQPVAIERAYLSYYKAPESPRSEGNEYGNPV